MKGRVGAFGKAKERAKEVNPYDQPGNKKGCSASLEEN